MAPLFRPSSGILATCALVLAACSGGGASEPPKPLAAPTGVTATPFDGAVGLSWSAAAGATSYNVYQSATSGLQPAAMTLVASGITGTAFNATAPNDIAQYFRVASVDAAGESPASVEVAATALGTLLPATPVGLVATESDSAVALDWDDVPGATAYRVYHGDAAGLTPSSPFVWIAASQTSFAVPNGTTQHYAVAALIGAAESAMSNEVSATPVARPWIDAYATLRSASRGFGSYQVQVCAAAGCAQPLANASVTFGGTTLVYDGVDTFEGQPSGSIAGASLQLVVTVPPGGPVLAGTYTATVTMYAEAPGLTSPAPAAVWEASQAHTFTWSQASPTAASAYVVTATNTSAYGVVLGTVPPPGSSYGVAANTLTPGSWEARVEIVSTDELTIPNTAVGSSLHLGASSDPVSFTVP